MLEDHNIPQLVGICGITLTYVLAVIFNALNGIGGFSIFKSTIGNLSNKYSLDFTPDGWAFSIWGIIYIWIGASIIFVICTIFKKNNDGFRLYNFNPIFDLIVCFIISLNFVLNITWLFVWDREDLVTSCAVLVFMALTNATTVWMLAKNISANNHELLRSNKKLYITYVIILNGFSLYDSWTTVASLINLGSTLRYVSQIPMVDASNVCLSILLVIFFVYFLLENTIFDRQFRFIIPPYLVLIWTTSAIVTKQATNPLVNDQTKMFVAAILAIACILFVLRMAIIIYKQKKNPLGKSDDIADVARSTYYGSIF